MTSPAQSFLWNEPRIEDLSYKVCKNGVHVRFADDRTLAVFGYDRLSFVEWLVNTWNETRHDVERAAPTPTEQEDAPK